MENKLQSVGSPLKISACSGEENLLDKDMFPIMGYMGSLKTANTPTGEIFVEVYKKIVTGIEFPDLFAGCDLKTLCLTQHQVKKFCTEYGYLIPRNSSLGCTCLFFLVEGENGDVCVVEVDSTRGRTADRFAKAERDSQWERDFPIKKRILTKSLRGGIICGENDRIIIPQIIQ